MCCAMPEGVAPGTDCEESGWISGLLKQSGTQWILHFMTKGGQMSDPGRGLPFSRRDTTQHKFPATFPSPQAIKCITPLVSLTILMCTTCD